MRLVIILNRSFGLAAQINAAGHLCVGAHRLLAEPELSMRWFRDRDDTMASVLTDLPLIVLEARASEDLLATHQRAFQAGTPAAGFFDCMRSGTPAEQEESIRAEPLSTQIYIGLLLIGSRESLKPLTKAYKLYSD